MVNLSLLMVYVASVTKQCSDGEFIKMNSQLRTLEVVNAVMMMKERCAYCEMVMMVNFDL